VDEELQRIPLFPLDVVLFPGMTLPLHIFEPHYREMTKKCLDCNTPFGVILAHDARHPDIPTPARVGTFAHILDYARLPDGRYNLLTRGGERFEVMEYLSGATYQQALVRALHDVEEPGDLHELASVATQALQAYLRIVFARVGSEDFQLEIPDDPSELSYLIGMCLTCEDCEKQEILEMRSLSQRLARGAEVLKSEADALRSEGELEDTEPSPRIDRSHWN
jgi:Lon protease-like protein